MVCALEIVTRLPWERRITVQSAGLVRSLPYSPGSDAQELGLLTSSTEAWVPCRGCCSRFRRSSSTSETWVEVGCLSQNVGWGC